MHTAVGTKQEKIGSILLNYSESKCDIKIHSYVMQV